MKKLFTLLLILCIVFTSCDANVEVVEGTDFEKSVDETVATTEEAVVFAPDAYKDNILKPDFDQFTADKVLQNSKVNRADIKTVTFLDRTSGKNDTAWDVSNDKNGSVWAWVENGVDLFIAGNGGVSANDCTYLFKNYTNVTTIDFNNCFYTDAVESTIEMFANCQNLKTLDLSTWDTSNVKLFNKMFMGCVSLSKVNFVGWNTSKATGMKNLFSGCASLAELDVSHFDISLLHELDGMFSGCTSLTSVGDLSSWNTEKIISMNSMFENCANLTSGGNLKIPHGCSTTDMYRGTPLAK